MNNSIIITFLGVPIAKKRHRSRITNGKIHTYSDQSQESLYHQVKLLEIMNESQGAKFRTETGRHSVFKVEMAFYLPYPKNLAKTKIKKNEEKSEIQYPKTRPDLDNYIKFYLDVMNEIVYHDDSAIVELIAIKE